MHRAAVRRDVLEVVEGRACVKFYLLPVTAVSLRAIDQTYASNFDECDHLGDQHALHTANWTLQRTACATADAHLASGLHKCRRDGQQPSANNAHSCEWESTDCHSATRLAEPPRPDMQEIQIFTQHTRSKYPHASQVAQRSG